MNKKLLLLIAFFFTVAFTSAQNTRFSVNSGNWNSTSTWSTTSGGAAGASVPLATDAVVIERGRTVSVNINNAVCASLQLGGLTADNSGTLTFSTTTITDPTLTVTGLVQVGGAGNANRDGIITFISGSTLTAGSLTLGNSAGTPGQGAVTMTSNSIMNVGAFNVINAGHAWFPSTGTVNMTTTNTLPTSIFTSFNNLTVSAGTTTAGADFSVSGVLNVAATTTLNMAAFAMTGAALNTSGIGTIRTQATATPLPTGRNWSGTVQYDRPAGGQVIMAGTYSNLTLSNTSGTQTASGALTVNGVLITTAGCTLNMGTNQLLGTLTTITNGGTIQTQNTTSTPIPTGKIWGGTVQYNGAGQTVMSGTYNNLTLSGSGVKTFAANTVIDNITAIGTGVQANLNAITTHTTGALLLNVANQVGGTWGTTTSGATSTNNTFFSGTGRITVPNNAIIDNNFASYSNSTADVFASVGEYTGPLTLTAPNGFVFINTKFASYGTPNGSYPNFTIGSCHAVNSRAITTGLLGNTIATIAPTNGVFTDPCGGTVKRYSIIATYAEPICSGNSVGVITGSTPTGGNGTYNYLWEQSTSVAGTYITVSGTSNAKDYTPGTLTATTYYRRTVTSGAYSDATIVIVPILSGPITAPVITSLCTNTLSVPASTIPGTYVQWFSGSCGGTVLATGTTYNPTAAGTYFARYTNRCASSSCSSFNVASTPPINTVSITPTSPNPICTGTSTASLVYTSTGSPNSYSITWSPNGYLIDIANRSLPNASSGTITLDIPANVLAGTYTGTITVRTSGGCVSASKTFTMQFNKAASIASSSPTLCQNTLMTPITHTTTGTTSIGAPTGLPIGVSASWASNTITISGTPTQSGTFNYSIPLTGSCSGTVNATGTITVNPPSVGGTVSGGTTVCSGANSTILTLLGHTGAVVRWESSLDNFATAGSAIANIGTTLTATNLSTTTSYRAVLQSGSCSIANSSLATVTVDQPSVGGTISGGVTVCSGINSTNLTLSGHTGTVVRWESSLDNFATAGSTIANTSTTLTVTNLSATTSYRAVLQSGSCSIANSSLATVTVDQPSVGGTISGGVTVCSGINSTNLTLSGHTGTVVRWESSLDNFATAGSTIANTSTTLTVTNLSATTSYRAVLQSGSCSIVNSSSAAVTVNPPSVGGTVSGGTTVCSGANSTILTLAGHTGAVVRWESSLDNFATAGSAIANIGTTLTATNLSTTTSYRAVLQSGSCSIANSSLATVTVNPPSVGGTVSGGTTVCSGTNSTVLTLAGHIGTITKWQSAVSPFSTWTDIANTAATYTSGSLSATTQFRAVVQSGSCAEVYSVPVAITVNSAPTITPNKVDETCATTNDGSISPTLFGGLTNVRYIKLTQKFVNADAWQQVQEIQALEVFTGSNVALSSTGAIATSSSIYNNDPGTFGPAKVNDGDAVGYSFWHSNSTNINEWVQVDLQSGKNIDYLRIYNRSDCCQNRGQNMLLELFDGANNLVYSRTVNLWENINGPHYIDVNILDLSWTDSATTLNRTGLDSATYILNYADAIGCSLSSPINIGSAIIAIPTQGTITPITCNVPVASVILNNLPSVGTWTLTQSGTATATISGTGSSATISGLAPGTYNFSVSIGGCSSSNLEAVKIDPLQETIWNGGWSNGLPNSDKKLIFTANYNQTIDLVACSCEVKSGNVTVSSGKTMTLTNELKVSGGIMKFENNASLVQINEDSTINSGAITYQRETVTPVDKFDYTYWSSPVSPQTLYNVSPNTLADKYMSFDAVTNNWKVENSITKVMEPGVGYSIRGPQNYYAPNPPNPFPASFIGVPHNGTIEVPITATDASYLLGNPYPSALDADAFLTNNAGVIDGTIYFWTHVTDIAPSGSQYIYNSDDYATYNLTGGVGTDNKEYPKGGVESISGSTKPTGKIASGQGFFATGIAAGNVEFKNAMRVGIGGITGENIQFFRTKNSKSKVTSSTIEKNRVWLNLTNTEGAFKQLLVGYVTGATNEYDTSYDGFSFSLNEYINFYSIVANEAMAIQGRALPFDENDLVPLGYSSAIVGDFSIGIDEVDGAMQSQNVFLEDKMLGVIHNLKEASYNFTTEKGVFNERFVLRYTDKTLGTGDFESEDKTIVVFKEKNELKIKSEFETMKRVTIFDLLGKKVFEETLKDVNEFRTSNITLKNQIVIVKVVLTNGQVVAKKVSY
ncbi:MAG: T9SS sorting signal type C domain-containing protein [Flavobacterium sp.]|nr:T9SS sorting signal type C domain-containing protein [Flavobacterium sp.]